MTYHIRRKPDVADNVRLIARDQIERAINELQDSSLDHHKVVHKVRKRCKKLRGLIRLVRPSFDSYGVENAAFRDAAGRLSAARDARAMLLTYDRLIDRFDQFVQRETLSPMREHLASLHNEAASSDSEHESLTAFLNEMREARRRVDTWEIAGTGFEVVEGGLGKTYRRARTALSEALADPNTANLHAWRKRVKYHWYHARLLRRIWPEMMTMRCAALGHLSDLLGDDHDLSVLREALSAHGDAEPPGEPAQLVIGLIDQRRAGLQAKAWPVGRRLFAEKPGNLVARSALYWNIWHDKGP